MSSLGLYLHIPFCQAICSYCNFNRGLLDAGLKQRYVSALEAEIRRAPGGAADTIFFGGGTPSLLEADEVARLIRACRETFDVAPDAEVTLETNPETVTADRLTAFREAGVTRISFGVQSFDDDELKRLGRVHSAARAKEAITAAQGLGFASVSFDLMLWLPAQTRLTWRRTVDQALALAPDHLSLYLLELYPNAPLKEEMARAGWSQTPEDDAADMYLEALDLLERAGLAQYEISNVARPGHRSRHNVKYWQAGQGFGVGCGAPGPRGRCAVEERGGNGRVRGQDFGRRGRGGGPAGAVTPGATRRSPVHGLAAHGWHRSGGFRGPIRSGSVGAVRGRTDTVS